MDDSIETRLRVVTWNIWWQFGPWEERLPRIIDELRRLDPDVVALQEVWATAESSASSVIATEFGFHEMYDSRLELDRGVRFGNAVVSRWPITGGESRPLPAGDEPDELRLVLRADIDGPRGALQVFSTHLNWRFDHSEIRQAQVAAIAEFVATSRPREYPAIVCGDFNAEPDSDEMRSLTGRRALAAHGVLLVDTWRVANPTDPGFTWDAVNPYAASEHEWDRRIDYVLTTWRRAGGTGHPIAASLVGTEPTDGVWPSDHFGVAVDLRY